MGSTVVDGLGLITWGFVLWAVGLLLLGEYRRLFFENPRAAMSFEVFAQVVLKSGGPGYFACALLVFGAFFVCDGVATMIVVILDWVRIFR
jgi:hypothetical protein